MNRKAVVLSAIFLVIFLFGCRLFQFPFSENPTPILPALTPPSPTATPLSPTPLPTDTPFYIVTKTPGIHEPIILKDVLIINSQGLYERKDFELQILDARTELFRESEDSELIYPDNNSDVFLTLRFSPKLTTNNLGWIALNTTFLCDNENYQPEDTTAKFENDVLDSLEIIYSVPSDLDLSKCILDLPNGSSIPIAMFFDGHQESANCSDPIGCVDISPTEPIHIAYMLTISGVTAFLGQDSLGAIEIAIDDRGGELLGHPILLTGEDSLCSSAGGQSAAMKVAADPTILGVIGTNCSAAATLAMPTISNAGLVMLSPSNTAPALTLEGESWQPGYFRICHTDLFQGSIAAEFAYNELGARTAATIHDGSPYANQLQQVFAGRFQELGGTITFQGAINVGDTDMRPVLTSVAANSPDILYFPIFEPEGPFIVAQSSVISGFENTTLMGADGLLADSFPENSGPNVVGMYLSGPYVGGPSYEDFLAKWKAKFGGVPPSGFHAFAYDGANILLDSIEQVAVVDDDGTVHIGRQALRDAIASVTDYTGLTGRLDCRDDDYRSFGFINASHGDCSTGEGLGIFKISLAELNGNWPPPIVYSP